MLYTPLTKKALHLCFAAHRDQVDKSGLSRLDIVDERALARVQKYQSALSLLEHP